MSGRLEHREARLAWLLMAPALAVLTVVGAGPLGATFWESLHRHDLRLPWLGRPFVGLANYAEAVGDGRFQQALGHTLGFAAVTVSIELVVGLAFALALDAIVRGRWIAYVTVLLPWALPAVVAALIWQFMFDAGSGIVNALLGAVGVPASGFNWFASTIGAWVPIVLGDVWKTAPFVSLLLLAGLQGIDPSLHEAARLDGASAWRRLISITLPLLRPAIVVAVVFRSLDALRVFDLVYVLTGGGPGTATEVISLYAFNALLQDLRFGFGSALSMLVFAVTFGLALACVRLLGAPAREATR